MRGGHRGARDGVGGAVAADPGGQDAGPGREDVEDAAVVREGGARPVGLDGADGQRGRLRRGRVVGGVGVVVAGGDDRQDAGGVAGADDAVEGRREAAAERGADHGAAGPALGGDVVEGPVEAVDDDRGRAARALEHLHGDDGRLLGHAVRLAGDRAGHVGAVADRVGGAAADGVVPERGAALELAVRVQDAGVDDVGVGALAGGGVVDVRGGAGGLVGDGAETPGGARLRGQGPL